MVRQKVIEIRQYIDRRGQNLFDRWFDKLEINTQARVTVSLDRLERGNVSNVKSVGYRRPGVALEFGPGYRIYFGMHGTQVVILLCGGTKKRQQSDIDAAKILWQEYKQRQREE